MRPAWKRFTVLLNALLALACLSAAVRAENWPQWRGPNLSGISAETNVPTQWSKTENVAWRLPLPGPAGATPVIWGERIFVTSVAGAEKSDLVLLCADTSGKLLWQETISSGSKDVRNDEGNFASPSPCTDGKSVWAFFGTGDLACYSVEGKSAWKLNVQDRYGTVNIQFGLASTPVLDQGRLYLQLIHGEGDPATREARVVCLDAHTGSEIWQSERPSDGRKECEHSYASPTIYRDQERAYLLTHGADYVVAHSLADGSELWRCGDLNPPGNYEPTLRFVASPVAVPGFIVVPSAKNHGVVCLRPDGMGNVTEDTRTVRWRWTKNTPDVPSPLVVNDHVYLCRENGNLICAEVTTGTEIYTQPTTRDRHRASPVFAGGNIYLTARNGTVTVVKEGRTFEVVSKNDMQESISASPAISGGRVYIRTFNALYAIGQSSVAR